MPCQVSAVSAKDAPPVPFSLSKAILERALIHGHESRDEALEMEDWLLPLLHPVLKVGRVVQDLAAQIERDPLEQNLRELRENSLRKNKKVRYGKSGVRHVGEMGGWAKKNKYLRRDAVAQQLVETRAHLEKLLGRLLA
tara:strand:+ start:166 stop:582 length:417 start_codon:yes stop_codon:yes gene_type:complete